MEKERKIRTAEGYKTLFKAPTALEDKPPSKSALMAKKALASPLMKSFKKK